MNGLRKLKPKQLHKKKYIYLISPSKIDKSKFFDSLFKIFKTKKIKYFQLRLKKNNFKYKLLLGRKIKKITTRFKVKLIINDDPFLAKKLDADGCHLGKNDMNIKKARKILKNKIIGVTCHNSKKLINNAIKNNASYIAIGAFFKTKTKKIKYKADIKILKYAKKVTNIPIVAIGGINSKNYKKLLLNNANFLAISGYIWKNKKLNPIDAINKLK